MIIPGQKEIAPKKKKKQVLTQSEMIDAENRRNEKDDEALSTESSGEESSSSSSDEDKWLLEKSKCNVVIKELEFDVEKKLTFSADVYNYTICANMTKCCSPLQ